MVSIFNANEDENSYLYAHKENIEALITATHEND